MNLQGITPSHFHPLNPSERRTVQLSPLFMLATLVGVIVVTPSPLWSFT